jgi:FkbM family methyltransferase
MSQLIMDVLRKYPATYRQLRKIYRLCRPTTTMLIQAQIVRYLKHKESVFFVQVGSNDGLQGDPIHDLIISHAHWKGIFIEPVPYLFHRLRRNYGNADRFIFENVAISKKSELRQFYYVSEDAKAALGENLPFWYDQTGSFDKSHLMEHVDRINMALQSYIVEEHIRTRSLQELFDRHDIQEIDLVHIDAEGYDYHILSQLDFLRYRPAVILFEHEHLSDDEKKLAQRLVEKHNYHCIAYGGDILALAEAERGSRSGAAHL